MYMSFDPLAAQSKPPCAKVKRLFRARRVCRRERLAVTADLRNNAQGRASEFGARNHSAGAILAWSRTSCAATG
jgi:hypothetical protein